MLLLGVGGGQGLQRFSFLLKRWGREETHVEPQEVSHSEEQASPLLTVLQLHGKRGRGMVPVLYTHAHYHQVLSEGCKKTAGLEELTENGDSQGTCEL